MRQMEAVYSKPDFHHLRLPCDFCLALCVMPALFVYLAPSSDFCLVTSCNVCLTIMVCKVVLPLFDLTAI